MNDQPPPRLYPHLSELPYSLRSLYTATLCILGLAYLFAATNLYFTYAGKAGGNPALVTYEDVVAAYAGAGKASAIENALNGSMSSMLTTQEKDTVLAWGRAGAAPASYLTDVKPIVDRRCLACHGGSNLELVDLSTYEGLKAVAAVAAGGESTATLIRDSHIHLFGMTFLFFVVGLMFSHACLRPVWLKSAVVAAPFAMIAVDIVSIDLIRLWRPFATVTIASGVAMAACFAFMWLTTLCQLWFFRPPEALLRRLGGDIPDDAA
jgi:hypothetical protein